MERITRKEFNSLENYNSYKNNIKYLDSKYLIKVCKRNSLDYLEFLVSLHDLSLPNLLFPNDIFEIIDDDSSTYAIKIKFLRGYNSLNSINFNKYTVEDILKLYKSILLSLKTIHELGLVQLDVANRNILIKNKNYFLFDWDTSLIFKENRLLTYNPLETNYSLNYNGKQIDLSKESYIYKEDFYNEDKANMLYILLRVLDNKSFNNLGFDVGMKEKYVIKTLNNLNFPLNIYDYLYNYLVLKEPISNVDYFEDVLDYLIEDKYKLIKK